MQATITKPRIFKSTCPSDSSLPGFLSKIDFEDAYAFRIPMDGKQEPIEDVYLKIFNTAPSWVSYALRFRNLVVAPFGLKTGIDQNKEPLMKEGERVGIFRIYKIFANEVIAGDNDKHLDFRVSVHRNTLQLSNIPDSSNSSNPSTITITTMVRYNNAFGRMYMSLIMPFHKMVVKSVLKSSVKRFKDL